MAAGSVTATARSTTWRGVSAKGRRRAISIFPSIPSCRPPASRSVEENTYVWPFDLYPQVRHRKEDRPAAAAAAPDARHHADLPDAQEPEHLVHLRRHPDILPGH